MVTLIQNIKGMPDILPDETPLWRYVEQTLHAILANYGYQEIRLPIVENTGLFKRAIGDVTDIVEKEMYSFEDRNGESLTLRPEGTAGCVRAGIQNGLLYHQQRRLWYQGQMFRHEAPQKGRYRQFHQLGIETFGFAGPDIDAEVILLTARFWKTLGLNDVILQLNSLGTKETRQRYREQLVNYFSAYANQLDEDCQRRLHTNPLRILDSKNPAMADLITNAPKLLDILDEESDAHFKQLCALLDQAGISYKINPCLVRGLDYYSKTVFEWTMNSDRAQNAIGGGGRFDYLVEQIGGHPTPAVGFAMGLERVIDLVKAVKSAESCIHTPDVYLITLGDQATQAGFLLSETLRDQRPELYIENYCGQGNLKQQLKKADKSGARIALIVGEDELKTDTVLIKYLLEDKPQISAKQSEINTIISHALLKS